VAYQTLGKGERGEAGSIDHGLILAMPELWRVESRYYF
jgi:hypothetical protein